MHLYDSVHKEKREFIPQNEGEATLYVCGPTVYDDAHLGHAKSALVFDLLTRVLRANGYDVTYARNITDIDVKIIKKAVEQKKEIKEITDFYTESYHKEMAALGQQEGSINAYESEVIENVFKMNDIEAYDIMAHPTIPNRILTTSEYGLSQYNIDYNTMSITTLSDIAY